MLSVIIWTIVIYLFIRFVFNFVIPVFQVTRKMREQVKDFNSRMQTTSQETPSPDKSKVPNNPKAGDYIDFEEVK